MGDNVCGVGAIDGAIEGEIDGNDNKYRELYNRLLLLQHNSFSVIDSNCG